MSDSTQLAKFPIPTQLRAELEAMVVGDLLGPAGGESEELTERSVRDPIDSATNLAIRLRFLGMSAA